MLNLAIAQSDAHGLSQESVCYGSTELAPRVRHGGSCGGSVQRRV